MDRRFIKPSVRRCLFGRPSNNDDFVQAQKRYEEKEAEQFKRRWNLDGLENDLEWTKADTDNIPEFYSKGYSHKCRRRAVRPCIGKTLSFADDHEDSIDDLSVRPVQYCTASTVEVFIGLLPHQPPQEPRTPTKNDSGHGDPQTPKSENDSNSTEVVTVSNFSSHCLRKNSTQTRLTDMWRVLKRRQRSLVPGQLHHNKRARIGRL